jgi:hypothetical protein
MRKRGNTGSPFNNHSLGRDWPIREELALSSAIFISEKERSEKNPNPKHARYEHGIDRDSCELVR